MIFDNVGFDVPAMAALKEREFVDIHMSNDAICRGKSKAEKRAWLQNVHRQMVLQTGIGSPEPEQTEETINKDD